MLLKPKKEGSVKAPKGSVESLDAFDHPIPGQSLTDEPGKWAFERPPQFSDVDEAVAFVISKIENDVEGKQEFEKHMMAGMPIESIVNTISFAGFSDGQWNPDVAEIIKLPLSAYFLMVAEEGNIPAIMFNQDPNKDQGLSDDAVMASMQEGNPEAYAHLQQQAAMPPMEEEQMMPEEGFLSMASEEDLMELEQQPMIEGEGMI